MVRKKRSAATMMKPAKRKRRTNQAKLKAKGAAMPITRTSVYDSEIDIITPYAVEMYEANHCSHCWVWASTPGGRKVCVFISCTRKSQSASSPGATTHAVVTVGSESIVVQVLLAAVQVGEPQR